LDVARREQPDLIVLDLLLPEMDGMQVCHALRAESRVPIIMLTARSTDEDKLLGLDLGADDYVTKPFNPRELVARVRAVLRRVASADGEPPPDVCYGDLTISFIRHEISLRNRPVNLAGEPVNPGWARLGSGVDWEGKRVGVLYVNPVAGPDPIDLAFISALNRSVLLGAMMAGLAAILVTLVLASGILRPVERLTAAARRLKTGDLSVRVSVDSQDEIGELANAFSAMAGSLAEQEQLRRNMIGDIAHELRNPPTNLRGYLEAARYGLMAPDAGLVDNLYEETMLLQRLMADLQELALAQGGQCVRQQPAGPGQHFYLHALPQPLVAATSQAAQFL
jgi:CheY-like chemotaxis protein